jgi:HD-GYP domain-containing protein (c-di-GMP phosphodiesterase class II)
VRKTSRTPGDPAPFSGPRGGAVEQDLVHALDTALRLARLHTLDNDLTLEALRLLTAKLGAYLKEHGRLSLVTSDGWLHVNERILGVDDETQGMVDDFVQLLGRNGLGGFLFTGRWGEDEVTALLGAFADASLGNADQRRAKLEGALDLPSDTGLEILAPQEGQAGVRAAKEMRSLRESASRDQELNLDDGELATYYACRLRALAEAVLESARDERPIDVYDPAVRLTLIKTIDALDSQAFQRRMQGLTLLPPEAEEPFAAHMANVAVHALCMGRLLGLHRLRLLELGLAGFYHDLGRASSGRQAASTRSAELRRTAERHVTLGVTLSLNLTALDAADLTRVVVAQEHHRVAKGGYPDSPGLRRPHVYSRLVAVADAFDRLECGTPWAPPVSPSRALERLTDSFEPRLVGLLQDVLGRHPRGTIAQTPDGETWVVVDGGARRGHRPVARRLAPGNDKLTEFHEDVELRILSPQGFGEGWQLRALP